MKRVLQLVVLLLALGALIQTAVTAAENKEHTGTHGDRESPGI